MTASPTGTDILYRMPASTHDRPPHLRPRRHRRRRHRRLLGGLSPGQARLDRRAAARAGPADLGLDLARRRAGRPAAHQRQHHPAAGLLGRALRPAGGRDRAGHGLEAQWRPAARLHARPLDRGPPPGDHRALLRPGDAPAVGARGAGAVAADDRRGRGRCRVPADRRPGQPVGHHPGAGQGRAHGRA